MLILSHSSFRVIAASIETRLELGLYLNICYVDAIRRVLNMTMLASETQLRSELDAYDRPDRLAPTTTDF